MTVETKNSLDLGNVRIYTVPHREYKSTVIPPGLMEIINKK